MFGLKWCLGHQSHFRHSDKSLQAGETCGTTSDAQLASRSNSIHTGTDSRWSIAKRVKHRFCTLEKLHSIILVDRSSTVQVSRHVLDVSVTGLKETQIRPGNGVPRLR